MDEILTIEPEGADLDFKNHTHDGINSKFIGASKNKFQSATTGASASTSTQTISTNFEAKKIVITSWRTGSSTSPSNCYGVYDPSSGHTNHCLSYYSATWNNDTDNSYLIAIRNSSGSISAWGKITNISANSFTITYDVSTEAISFTWEIYG